MPESIELRANKILGAMTEVLAALPPEMRQMIEDVYAGRGDGSATGIDRSGVWATVERLVSLFDDCDFEAFGDNRLIIAWSWWTIINRQVRAIKTLVDSGLEGETFPNVRVAFEYSMALVTLSDEDRDEVLIALIANLMSDLSKLNTRSTGAIAKYRDAVDKAKSELDSIVVERWVTGFTKRADGLQVDARAYNYYGILSMLVHPTIVAVMGFADLNEFKTTTKHSNAVLMTLMGDPALWSIQCLCWSALAIDHIVDGGLPWRRELFDALDRFEIPYADTLYPR
jgi:hypothetical protein